MISGAMDSPVPERPQAHGVAQDQFLTVLSRDEALRRFEAALDPKPVGTETVAVAQARGRVLAQDVAAPTRWSWSRIRSRSRRPPALASSCAAP